MQTSEPGKKSNWIFVALLVISLPLLFVILYLINTRPVTQIKAPIKDSSQINTIKNIDTLKNITK